MKELRPIVVTLIKVYKPTKTGDKSAAPVLMLTAPALMVPVLTLIAPSGSIKALGVRKNGPLISGAEAMKRPMGVAPLHKEEIMLTHVAATKTILAKIRDLKIKIEAIVAIAPMRLVTTKVITAIRTSAAKIKAITGIIRATIAKIKAITEIIKATIIAATAIKDAITMVMPTKVMRRPHANVLMVVLDVTTKKMKALSDLATMMIAKA